MILVAEDNEAYQIVVEQILIEAGYSYVIVENGKLALEQFKAERPDLAPNLRYLPFGNYLIFYLPEEEGLVVIRVLHGARRIEPELFAPVIGKT